MPSPISLAVLATFIGVMVLGNGLSSNDIQIEGRESKKIQVILDLYCAKLKSSLNTDVYSTLAEGYTILDETYRYEFLVTTYILKEELVSDDYSDFDEPQYHNIQIPTPIVSLKIVSGIYYFNNDSSSTQLYSVRTDGVSGKNSVIEGKASPSFFDSITISYPNERMLNFKDVEIHTDKPYIKYRVAHHLLEKLFFIGFNSTKAISGTLFCSDLRGANSSSAQATEVFKDKSVDKFVDVAVDQYTGDILLATDTKIFALHKLTYFSKVDRFTSSPH